MKTVKILVMFIMTLLIISCQQNNRGSDCPELSSDQNCQETAVSEQTTTSSPPAALLEKFDNVSAENGIFVAIKNDQAYFFDGEKQLFPRGANGWAVEENYISAFVDEDGSTMLYFFKTGVILPSISRCSFFGDAFLCEMPDGTYAFYSAEGEEKASGLKNIFYLIKFRGEYATGECFYVFSKDDGTRLFYDETGDLRYTVDLTTWQKLVSYLKQDKDEDRAYKWTFTYRINIHRFLNDHLSHGIIPTRYPEE